MILKDKILETVKQLDLNLKGRIVLTEAATGAYVVTPIIAALSGAKVYAFTKSTRYGSVEEVKHQTGELLEKLSIDRDSVHIVEDLTPELINIADIITNSGHLRPLNAEKLQYSKQGLVIPLMYEAWELREGDLDLNFCKKNEIRVGATNERHPDVDVFNFLGDMAIKLIFDAGFNLYKNKFVLICNNDFGPYIAKVISKICAGLAVCDLKENKNKYNDLPIDWIGDFPNFSAPEKYKNCTAIIFTAYPFEKSWIGDRGEFLSMSKLKSEFNYPFILRYAGHIDDEFCKGKLNYYPEHVPAGHMGILPSDIGYDPIIRLQAGGLKVGELMLKEQIIFKDVPLVINV
ncbi:MAG: hypothetical protein ACK452_03600 [Bacteroidota bacterium]